MQIALLSYMILAHPSQVQGRSKQKIDSLLTMNLGKENDLLGKYVHRKLREDFHVKYYIQIVLFHMY